MPLLPDFAASADASVSFDGANVLFSGKKTPPIPGRSTSSPSPIAAFVKSSSPQPTPSARSISPVGVSSTRSKPATASKCSSRSRTPNRSKRSKARELNPSSPSPLCKSAPSRPTSSPMAASSLNRCSRSAKATSPELYLVYSDGSGVESYRCDHSSERTLRPAVNSNRATSCSPTARASPASPPPLRRRAQIAAPRAEYAGASPKPPQATGS